MFSTRSLIFLGICGVCLILGFVLYSEYDVRRYRDNIGIESQPYTTETRSTESTSVDEPLNISDTAVDDVTHINEKKTMRIDTPVPDNVRMSSEVAMPDTSPPIDEITPEISLLEKGAALEAAFTFQDVTDINATYNELEAILNERLDNDPKITPFLNAWKSTYYLIQDAKTIKEMGGSGESLLTSSTVYVVGKFVESTVDLLNLSDAEAAKGRSIVQQIEDTVEIAEIVNDTKPMIEQAIHNRELTREEAGDFFRMLLGPNIEVVVE